MIVDLPDTTVSKISQGARQRPRRGRRRRARPRADAHHPHPRRRALEEVIEAANDASREHPMRVIVLMIDGADADVPARRADPRRRRRRRERGRRRSAPSASRAARTTRASSPACSCPMPPSSSGGRTRPRTARRRPRSARSRSAGSRMPPPSPTRRPGSPRSARTTLRATPTSPGRVSRTGASSSRPCSTSRRTSRSRRSRCAARPTSPSTALLAAWLRLKLDVPVDWRVPARATNGRTASSRCGSSATPAETSCSSVSSPAIAVPHPARTARARPRASAPHAARVPRRGAPSPRSGRPVWSSDHRGLGALGATGDAGDAWLSIVHREAGRDQCRSRQLSRSRSPHDSCNRLAKCVETARSCTSRSPADRWARRCWPQRRRAPAVRQGRLVARALLVERRALRRPRTMPIATRSRRARRCWTRSTSPPRTSTRWPPATSGIDLDAAAAAVCRGARALFAARTTARPWPSFDICFLGVGPDGTSRRCSPTAPRSSITDRAAVAVRDSPKPPPERVTLTRPVINALAARVARAGRRRQGGRARVSPSPVPATRVCRRPVRRGAAARCSSSTKRQPRRCRRSSSTGNTEPPDDAELSPDRGARAAA